MKDGIPTNTGVTHEGPTLDGEDQIICVPVENFKMSRITYRFKTLFLIEFYTILFMCIPLLRPFYDFILRGP